MVKKIVVALLVVFVLIFVGIYLTGLYLNDSASNFYLNQESDELVIGQSEISSQTIETTDNQVNECPKTYNEGYDDAISIKAYEKITSSSFALNITPQKDFEVYLEYGLTTELESKTKKYFIEADNNLEIVLSELTPSTKYYFAINYREDASDSYMVEFIQGKKFFFITADE